jgi:hypothetical protein
LAVPFWADKMNVWRRQLPANITARECAGHTQNSKHLSHHSDFRCKNEIQKMSVALVKRAQLGTSKAWKCFIYTSARSQRQKAVGHSIGDRIARIQDSNATRQ